MAERTAEETGGEERLAVHQRELLVASRCCHCAEVVPRKTVLRAEPCPHCEQSTEVAAGAGGTEVVEALAKRWKRVRWYAYGVLAAAGLIAGLVPLLAALVRLVGLIALHLLLVRRPLRWLSLKRRVCAKLGLKLLLAVLAVAGLVVDVLVAPALSLAAPVAAIVTLAFSVIYAEAALALIRSRVAREARGEALAVEEWMLPAVLLGGILALSVALVGAAWLTYYTLVQLELPGVGDIAAWLSPGGGSG